MKTARPFLIWLVGLLVFVAGDSISFGLFVGVGAALMFIAVAWAIGSIIFGLGGGK